MTGNYSQQGFTLIEVLLSLAIIAILSGLSLPLYQTFQKRNDIDITISQTASFLRRAQNYSKGVAGDSQWGVKLQSGSITLYKGTNYASRDTAFDEIFEPSLSVTFSGPDDVNFSKLTGLPSSTTPISLANDINDVRTVNINAKGTVTY